MLAAMPMSERMATLTLSVESETEAMQSAQIIETLGLAETARRTGWHESRGRMSAGLSVIAAMYGGAPGLGELALGIGGPTERIAAERNRILDLLERATGKPLARD